MVVGRRFRRSESFPALKAAAKSAFRSRCISLPSRSHPFAAHLADDLQSLRSWPLSPSSASDAVHWICNGLARLHLLLASLSDVLQLPQAQEPLRRGHRRSPALADRLLDDFLRLADAHGSFRSATLALKQDLAAAQVAVRRRDERRLACYVRAQRRARKELAELAAAAREVKKRPQPGPATWAAANAEEAEVARVIGEVVVVAAEASAAVFLGVSEMAAAASSAAAAMAPSRFAWANAVLRWRTRATSKPPNKKASPEEKKEEVAAGEEEEEEEKWRRTTLERLGKAEEGVPSLESAGELVFKSLVNVRVTLLNVLTPAL
ncbi:unnamed protein product [Musa acuminata subsp. malaccensis]|uniref:(wild Malaysian banana) hypothetical protein n=1 Tax=Musa acuminata subsp. malaccensis TaxID=214687 RepID=A0A804L2Y8_MUSAM|nr:PREDICTED: uncharacterized protein LOC103970129 [Musa acuminata subsp. malaccensis]CAG1863210.1 unnamed protein product [Musa acuminata subsp. malaccensis]